MSRVLLYSYVEDPPSAAVARKIVTHANDRYGLDFRFRDGFPSIQHGFGNIKRQIPALVKMATQGIHTFVMADLDTAECPPTLMRDWLKQRNTEGLQLPSELVFRIAVREIESWILADRAHLVRFLGISEQCFSRNPDELPDPKQHLINVIRQKGQKKWHREMLPQSPTATVGPLYNEKMCTFVKEHWDPRRAEAASPSLARAIKAFYKFKF